MYPFYYSIIVLVSIIALLGTVFIAKEMSKQEEQPSSKDEVEKLKSESKSSNSIPMLTTIYSITFVITGILVWIFII